MSVGRLIVAALLCSCLILASEDIDAQGIDKEKLWDAYKAAVVQLHAFGKGADGEEKTIDAGTGIFVSPDGYIITAAHVVGTDEVWSKEGPDQKPTRHVEITALDTHGTPQIVARDAAVKIIPNSDIALLRINGFNYTHAGLSSQRPKGFPSLVAIVWSPNGKMPRPFSGDLTTTDVAADGDVLTVQLAVTPGYSGSPIFDSDGQVIGIIARQLGPTLAIVVPSTDVVNYLPGGVSGGADDPIAASAVPPQTGKPETPVYALCRHPDHGIEGWAHEENWNANSGWRKGGSSPDQYCGAEKIRREKLPGSECSAY